MLDPRRCNRQIVPKRRCGANIPAPQNAQRTQMSTSSWRRYPAVTVLQSPYLVSHLALLHGPTRWAACTGAVIVSGLEVSASDCYVGLAYVNCGTLTFHSGFLPTSPLPLILDLSVKELG